MALLLGGCAQKAVITVVEEPVEEFVEEPAAEARIAMILPYKLIGRYSYSTTTAVFGYLLTREKPFELRSFQIEDESPAEIERVLDAIKEKGFRYVIAPLTPKGASIIAEKEEDLTVFFPTVNRNDIGTTAENIFFGAIDYKAQIEKLMPYASSPLVIMYDESVQGRKLLELTKEGYLENSGPFQPTSRRDLSVQKGIDYLPELEPQKRKVIAYGLDRHTTNMKSRLQSNEMIQFGSFFLNTPVVKSTMILSQLSLYDTDVTNILSTQINYDPLILSMTQRKDREHLYIANSISINDDLCIETNSLLSNDIVYDWINYASTIGADYFYHRITREERRYDLPMAGNQVIYPVTIVQPYESHFIVIENE